MLGPVRTLELGETQMVPQIVSPQVRMLGKHFTHWERAHQVFSASICLFQILCCSTRHPSSLCFSRAFRHLEYAGSCQHFDMDETETGPCGYPPKNQNVGHTFHFFLSMKKLQVEDFLSPLQHWVEVRKTLASEFV